MFLYYKDSNLNFDCFDCFTDNLLTECPPWTNRMQNGRHTKSSCCVDRHADLIFLIHTGQGHLVVLVRVGSIHRPWCLARPGCARDTARLRCNQSKYSRSSRHLGVPVIRPAPPTPAT